MLLNGLISFNQCSSFSNSLCDYSLQFSTDISGKAVKLLVIKINGTFKATKKDE